MKNYLLPSLGIVFCFAACKKDFRSYTATGRLLEGCSGAPISNRSVRVVLNYPRKIGGKTITAGSALTDANGNFAFNISAAPGWEELGLMDESTNEYYTTNTGTGPLQPVDDQIALGTFYRRAARIGRLRIQVGSGVGPNDTLFYGPNGFTQLTAPAMLYPIVPTTLTYTLPTERTPDTAVRDTEYLYWGVGRASFDSSVARVRRNGWNDPTAQTLRIPLFLCGVDSQQVTLTLP